MNKINKLQNKFKLSIKNKDIFNEAFIHKSANEIKNNERLEFLGDRVLGLVISKKLLELFPDESEGVLDKKLSNLVNRKVCAFIAWSNNLQDFITLGVSVKKIKKSDERILSDVCEAFIGAIYLDNNFDFIEQFILKLWKSKIASSHHLKIDSKTLLQEYSLKKFKILPTYKLESVKGPAHKPFFKISVKIKNSKKFFGLNSSKKNAQQDAAKKFLKTLNLEK